MFSNPPFGYFGNAVLILFAVLLTIPAPALAQEKPEPLRVMSFNIRYGKARDGDNHWKLRKALVSQTIKEYSPDLLGTQETLQMQADFLKSDLPDYTYVGRSREADENGGEHCGIFYRTGRFTKLAEGHFWLSETPDRPGSKSWDSSLPRMVTWVKLWDLRNEKAMLFFNTHFDHRGKMARNESAKLIARQIAYVANGLPAVLSGDFNTAESTAPYDSLFADGEGKALLVDTYRVKHPTPTQLEGTFNGFKGTLNGPRIDWIGVTRSFETEEATIDHTNDKGRWPSDHCPVTAVIKFRE